ncbi:aldo/keto reductase [Prevotella sp. 10(H)]|uniref:aldo/keto reductase n=1 Tax=Prevotella sp. 10(H) TaxID=1158294 RepID=UPI00056913AB|nr:aldo/keto reductase [Prevotella sp. 10(H)]
MEKVKLNNGVEMPLLGFGVFQVSDLKECKESVLTALETGYRLLDTAAVYENETAVGEAVKESGIPREEIFITTKVWVQDTGYEKTKESFIHSLRKLGTDYIDLFLIHMPYGDVYGSWRAMEDLYKEGKIRAIGVSNFYNDRVIDFILHNEIIPAVNQIETHPFLQNEETHKFLENNGIQIESWGPFAEGKNGIFRNEILKAIGKKYGKSVAQVILRWLTQRGVVAIPKSVRKERIVENFNIFDFHLTDEDMQIIRSIDMNQTFFNDYNDPEAAIRMDAIRFIP